MTDKEIQLPTVNSDEYTRLSEALEYAEDNAVTSSEAILLKNLRMRIHDESKHPDEHS